VAGEVINVATGTRISLNKLWQTMAAIEGSSLQPEYGAPRVGDVRDSLADITKARTYLGYTPIVALQEGLEKTLASL
jgi:nucleoside-diphosphate-sugar epimerase